MSKKLTKEQAANREKAWKKLESLRGGQIYCQYSHASRSGMSHRMEFYVNTIQNGSPYLERIGYYISLAEGIPYDINKGGLLVTGGNMDMKFHTILNLNYGYAFWKHPGKSLQEIIDSGEYGSLVYDKALFDANRIGNL